MRKNVVPAFIQKTWEMLEGDANSPVVQWRNDGCSFEITDLPLFQLEVLPRYFKHANFSSFIRQLNMYNFHKKKTSEGPVEFHHKLFRRNQQQLLIGIKRKPSQADLQLGDELIKQLAPDYLAENFSQQKQKEQLLPSPIQSCSEEAVQPLEELAFVRPILGLLSWSQNQGQCNGLNEWRMQKKIIKTMIIKKPPVLGMENQGF